MGAGKIAAFVSIVSVFSPEFVLIKSSLPAARRLRAKKRQAVDSELRYLEGHAQRMDRGAAQKRGQPLGSGAMEST